jgi:hypothetical protein
MSEIEKEESAIAAPEENKKGEAQDEDGDGEVYNQSNEVLEEKSEGGWKVINPTMTGGHIVYMCQGVDEDGSWSGNRRYNEFHKLVEHLEKRWPGIPIPTLPPKKVVGNKDVKFINERRFYLERFLKKLSVFGFIINSEEFKVFSRPAGDIEKGFSKLPPLGYGAIVERMRLVLEIEEHMYDPVMKDELNVQSVEFMAFSKQILPFLKNMQNEISKMMINNSQSIIDYKTFLNILSNYEDFNL